MTGVAGRGAPRALRLVLALAVAVAWSCGGDGGGSGDDAGGLPGGLLQEGERRPEGMTVTSTAFAPGGAVPERFSCEGDNVPPPLRWTGTPETATELAVVVEDPDAPDGTFVHWLVVGIDPATAAVDPADPLPGAEVLPGSSENDTYIGPCPPSGSGVHRYAFEVYALGSRPDLSGAATPLDKVRALRAAAVAGGVLVGTFER